MLPDQVRITTDCIKETNETEYPASVPFYKIISKQTYETKNSQIKMTSEAYQREHLIRARATENHTVLDGTHFIYLDNVPQIRSLTEDFLSGAGCIYNIRP